LRRTAQRQRPELYVFFAAELGEIGAVKSAIASRAQNADALPLSGQRQQRRAA